MPPETNRAPARPASRLPSVKTYPRCKGCGTSVREGHDFCTVCQQRPQFQPPKATMELGPQPEPLYHRVGNYRRIESTPDEEGSNG